MLLVTTGVAIFFSLLGLTRRYAGAALGVLIFSMLIWPEFLRVPVGPIQMSVPRILALLLLIKFFTRGMHHQLRFNKIDLLVILVWVWTVFATIAAGAEFSQVSQMIGRGLDTVLVYFVARLALLKTDQAVGLFRWLAITALTMCAFGVYEAVTWSSPYHTFSGGNARIEGYSEIRYGFLRAQASTQVSIYFGMAMMLLTGLIWSVRGYVRQKRMFRLSLLASAIATLSSLSSGPWIAFFMLVGVNSYYKYTRWIKPTLIIILCMAILLELASNRHFYHLIDYLAINSSTAWYRTRLLEIAVNQMGDYWLFGVGSDWPHHWAALLDGRAHIDVVNNFVIIALYGGLLSLLMFVLSHALAIKQAIIAFKTEKSEQERKLLFGLSATLVALDLSSLSVGLFGPALLLSSILLGMLVSSAVSINNEENH